MLVPRIRLAALGDIGDLGPQIGDLRRQGRGIPLKILAPDVDAGLENRHARYLPPPRPIVTRPRPLALTSPHPGPLRRPTLSPHAGLGENSRRHLRFLPSPDEVGRGMSRPQAATG